MKRMVILAATTLIAAFTLVDCSSPADEINDACAQVKQVTDALPGIKDDDGAKQIVPRINQQIDAAHKVQGTFREANANPRLQGAWQQMIDALQQNREAWNDSTNPNRAPGSDMVIALGLADKKSQADKAKASLNSAAQQSGDPTCGAAIKWVY